MGDEPEGELEPEQKEEEKPGIIRKRHSSSDLSELIAFAHHFDLPRDL